MRTLFERFFGKRLPAYTKLTLQQKEALQARLKEAHAIIQKYGAVLEEHPSMICDEQYLPAPKELIKASILLLLRGEPDEQTRGMLKGGYLMLSTFQPLTPAEKAIIQQQSKFGLNEFKPPHIKIDEANKMALAGFLSVWPAYHELEKRTSAEMDRLVEELGQAGFPVKVPHMPVNPPSGEQR